MTATAAATRAQLTGASVWLRSTAAVPLALYAIALVAGLLVAGLVTFPTNEGSAYYVAVARSLATGRGLVIDTMWSYATPPLVLPRPAFELWQPLASFIAAAGMAVTGSTLFAAAQVGGVALGATIAPLTWAITRDAGRALELPPRRLNTLAVGAALLSITLAPFVLAITVPDSTLPFLVFGTLACWLAPRALEGRSLAALALGAALGLAYLARHEAVYIGLVIVTAMAVGRRDSLATILRRLGPVVIGGLVMIGPWLLRNAAVFGTPFPGQALDNALLTSNEQIYAYSGRPTFAEFLGQGPAQLAANIVSGTTHNLVNVLLLLAMPVGLVGLVSVALLMRGRRLPAGPLLFLLASGGVTFAIASLVFPVASRWGTFQHAAGPFIVGLTVAAVLGADRLVEWVGRKRRWQRANTWLTPLALSLVALLISGLQLVQLKRDATSVSDRYAVFAAAIQSLPEAAAPARPVVISDHPLWLADATGLPTLALPAEAPDTLLRLAQDQHATLILVAEGRDPYPAALRAQPYSACFVERPLPTSAPAGSALFVIAEECR